MATLEDVCAAGLLFRFDTELDVGEEARRWLYVTPEFDRWLATELPTLPRDRGRNLAPLGQLDVLFHDFIVGFPMVYDVDRRRLEPQISNVWELKSEDIRVFGWFVTRGHFVAVAAAMRKDLKPAARYRPFIDRVCAVRAALPLDEPRSTTGVSADAVL